MPRPEPGAAPFHEWVFPDGRRWARFYRHGTDYLIRFPDLADFVVSADGRQIAAHPFPGVSPQTVEHLYLNQALPLALSRRWKLVFHGSAVEIGDCAVAFVGASGAGKSTLAASFATAGGRFLTDDGLLLEPSGEGYAVQPSHPSIRLWEDSRQALALAGSAAAPPVDYTPKARVLAGNEVAHCEAPRPLRALYFLGDGETEDVRIAPLPAPEAMIELVRHSFLLDVDEREMLARHFAQLAELVRLPLFFRLDFPRAYERLAEVRTAIGRHAAAPG